MLQNWKYYIFIISLLLVQPISLIPFNQQVDIHRFAQYFSTHLSFDHLELAYTQFSKKLSNHFQHLIRVSLPQQSQQVDDSVDLQILSGQLKGAVGSYIEDSLQSIWNTHAASSIDRISLSNYIEQMSVQLCLDPTLVDFNINSQHVHKSRTTVSSECLERNAEHMMTLVDEYIQNHLSSVVSRIVVDDIPPLFLTTKFHVKSIVDHFDRYTQQHVLFEMNNASLGNPQDIINSIIQVANLNHSIDSIHSLRKFTSSATIH